MKKYLSLAALSLSLMACAPALQTAQTGDPARSDLGSRPNAGINGSSRNLLTYVAPELGRGSVYKTADNIKLDVKVRDDGYLTVQRIGKDGLVTALARDLAVQRGDLRVSLPSEAFDTGLQRLRVSFSRVPTATSVGLSGALVEGTRQPATVEQLSREDALLARDVQETFFYIQPEGK